VPSYIISKLARKLSSNHRKSSAYQICSPAASSSVGEYPWFCSTLFSTNAAFTTICHYTNTHQMGLHSSNGLHLHFRRRLVWNSARSLAILNAVFHGFPQSLQAITWLGHTYSSNSSSKNYSTRWCYIVWITNSIRKQFRYHMIQCFGSVLRCNISLWNKYYKF
jgi:hypothetical protein